MHNERSTHLETLIDQANAAFETGENEKAVELLQKVVEGYLIRNEFGEARKILYQLFPRLTSYGLIEKVFFIVQRIIQEFERGEAFEEGADLLQYAAELARENQEYRIAADFYRSAGNFWQRAGGQTNSQSAAICFVRAAEAYGYEKKSNKAERLFVRAVMSALNIEQELLGVAEQGWRALAKDRCNSASEHFRSVSKAFQRGVPELQNLLTPEEVGPLSANATARLYHLSASFAFLTALCFLKLESMGLSEEEFELVRESALSAIKATMPILEEGLSDNEDVWRTCVDLLLLVIAEYFAGVPWENAALIADIRQYDEENEVILLAAEAISNGQVKRSLDYLEMAELGMLDAAKPFIIDALQTKKEFS